MRRRIANWRDVAAGIAAVEADVSVRFNVHEVVQMAAEMFADAAFLLVSVEDGPEAMLDAGRCALVQIEEFSG